jgi:predicted ATP-grasp superfamily ATP-dependent carboligase
VLVTDGDARAALAAVRSLVARGHRVHVLSPHRRALAGVSRGVTEHAIRIDAWSNARAFAQHVSAALLDIHADALIPVTDASATALLTHAELLPPSCAVLLPALAAFARASDKAGLLPLAQAAGFAVPQSVVISSPDHAGSVEIAELAPGVLKPHRSVVIENGTLRRHGVVSFETRPQGEELLRTLPASAYPVVVQRRVAGPGVGFFALRWKGKMIATFAHRRIREVPPTGGVSVCRESIVMPPALLTAGTRLLEALDWQGVAMIECKHDVANDRYYVIEINPRLWGSLQLAIDAGVDFPALLVACALGEDPNPVSTYRTGIRSRWGWGELDYVYLRTKLRAPGSSLPGAFAGALAEVLRRSPRRDRGEILRLSDPLPFVVETLQRLGLKR